MPTVAITGVGSPIGQRLLGRLADDPSIDLVVGIDGSSVLFPPKLRLRQVELRTGDLKQVLEGVDAVVHVAWDDTGGREDASARRVNVDTFRRVLDAAGDASVGAVVHLSSATVYGAWPDNAVPLVEDAALRPNPGFTYAAEQAECERMLAEWRADHPSARAVSLRSAVILAAGEESWLSRALGGTSAIRVRAASPPLQFVHPDDVAAALHLAVVRDLDGAYNLAPDSWIPGEIAAELAGGPPRVGLPEPVAARVSRWGWRLGLSEQPPSVLPYATHPWVVANDRLKAAGWDPEHTNEEVLVEARPGSRWRELSPKRRQEIALAASGGVLVAAIVTIVALVRRARRRAAG